MTTSASNKEEKESGRQWLRKCSLLVGKGSDGLELGDLRIVFKTTKGDIETPNSAEIAIYNLSETTSSKIRKEFIVQSFDPVAMTVTVQPAVAGRVTDETGKTSSVNMPLLPDVPVVFPGGGGFTLTFPVASGDECLVVFASRCIDAWWQSGGIGEPMEPRMHDLSDGFALVGVRSQARRLSPAVDSGNVQIRSDDGKTFVEMTPGGDVNTVGPTSVTLKSEGSITLDAPQIIIKGLLSMQSQSGGATTATLDGSLNATGDVTASNISLNSHTHPGDSGGPREARNERQACRRRRPV